MSVIKNFYRKESLENLNSTEQFNNYIHQAKLRWWVFALILVLIVLSTAVWATFAKVPKVITCRGLIQEKNTITCYLPTEDIASIGNINDVKEIKINMLSTDGVLTFEENIPLSYGEISESLKSDWLLNNLVTAPFSYHVKIKTNPKVEINDIGTICNIAITIGTQAPIHLLTR
ncbi:MAG: hypothetical protein GX903_10710 [Spirochaetales bacterium]|nr:hypothetical protein [Spirochaetales bacterium]